MLSVTTPETIATDLAYRRERLTAGRPTVDVRGRHRPFFDSLLAAMFARYGYGPARGVPPVGAHSH